MTDKPNPLFTTIEKRSDQPPLEKPSMTDPRMRIVDGTSAPIVYFDAVPFYAFSRGVASITVTAQRQIADETGYVTEDRIITGLLRAPFEIMLQVRDIINEMERKSQEQLAAAIAAAEAEKPTGKPH